jgi:hypothetical protein
VRFTGALFQRNTDLVINTRQLRNFFKSQKLQKVAFKR